MINLLYRSKQERDTDNIAFTHFIPTQVVVDCPGVHLVEDWKESCRIHRCDEIVLQWHHGSESGGREKNLANCGEIGNQAEPILTELNDYSIEIDCH